MYVGERGMGAVTPEARRRARRRWAALLVLSGLVHVMLLGGFAIRIPALQAYPEPLAMDVVLVQPPPFIRPLVIQTAKPPPNTRVVVLDAPPRYAPPLKAATGDAGDAVDLFGPVFADGMWPRPVLVRTEPCDSNDDVEAPQDCRRELLLIGLASDAADGAKAAP
jgi:hypothetical protein